MNEEQVNNLRRLALAMSCFQQVKELSEHVLKLKLVADSDLYTGCVAGIVVTYMRPFVGAYGIGSLGEEFLKFPDPVMGTLHDEIRLLRNKVYAHHDSVSSKDKLPRDAYKTRITIRKNELGEWALPWVERPQMTLDTLPDVVRLAALQIENVHNATVRLLKPIMEGRTYAPGDYVLGENFP